MFAHGIFFGADLVAPPHHAPVVRIAGTAHAYLVAVVDHGHAIDGQHEGQPELELLVSSHVVDFRRFIPADLFLVADFRIRQVAVGIGHEARLVVVAEKGRHECFLAVDRLGRGERALEFVHAGFPFGENIDDGVIEREIELPVEHVGSDEAHDALAVHEGFANIVERDFAAGIDRGAQGRAVAPPEGAFDVLDRVEPVAVEFEAQGEVDRVADEEFDRLGIVEVEAGQPFLEPGGELVIVPAAEVLRAVGQFERAEEFATFVPHRVVGMHVLEDEIGDDEHLLAVRGRDHVGERDFPAEARLHFGVRNGPVTVVTGVEAVGFEVFLPRAVRVAIQGGQPKDIDAEVAEIAIVDLLAHTLEVAALVVGRRQNALVLHRPIVLLLPVVEAVGEGVIDHAVLPLEFVGRLGPDTRGVADIALGVGDDDAHPGAVGQAGRVDRDRVAG